MFSVDTKKFSGPIDLLLSMIENRKLSVNDVSLSKIADEFISYINNPINFSLKNGADFVYIAATLLLIKSKSLLPTLSLTEREESDIEDLQDRLKIFKIFKDRLEDLNKIFSKKVIFFAEEGSFDNNVVFTPSKDLTKDNITLSILGVIKRFPKEEQKEKKSIKKTISLEEVIENLSLRIKKSFKMSFRDFSNGLGGDKISVVVSFLAMLELVRGGNIDVNQYENFSDINMENRDISAPIYG